MQRPLDWGWRPSVASHTCNPFTNTREAKHWLGSSDPLISEWLADSAPWSHQGHRPHLGHCSSISSILPSSARSKMVYCASTFHLVRGLRGRRVPLILLRTCISCLLLHNELPQNFVDWNNKHSLSLWVFKFLSHEFQSCSQDVSQDYSHVKARLGLKAFLSNWHTPCHIDLSIGLVDYSRDMAAGFPRVEDPRKRESKEKASCLFCPNLGYYTQWLWPLSIQEKQVTKYSMHLWGLHL